MTAYVCPFCGRPVRPNGPDVYREVAGWVQQRKEGGVHALVLREDSGRWAHAECITLAKAGSGGEQLDLGLSS